MHMQLLDLVKMRNVKREIRRKRGKWPSWLMRCKKNWIGPRSNLTRRLPGLKDSTSLQDTG